MKDLELYEELELEVIPFSVEDIIRTSGDESGSGGGSDDGDGGEDMESRRGFQF